MRSTEASSEVITLSAEFAAIGAAAARSSFVEMDLQQRVDDVVGADCGLVEYTATTLRVDLSGCPELSGSIEITFPNAACLDPASSDPACLGDLVVNVETALEIEGISINGTFETTITDDSIEAAGDIEVDVAGDELDVTFDLSIAESGDCELLNGTVDVTSSEGDVSVAVSDLLDCGECPESGSLSVQTADQSVVVDFDAGSISVNNADGEPIDAELSSDAAI